MNKTEYIKLWRKNNPGKSAEYQRRYQAKYPGRIKEQMRNWRRNNPEASRNITRRLRARNVEIMRTLKDVLCTDCGVQYPYYVMDFDHRENKSYSINLIKHYSVETFVAELDKCDVVCSNCHRERTHRRSLQGAS